MGARSVIIAALVLVLSVPFFVRTLATGREGPAVSSAGSRTLVVVTPHVEQILDEFGAGFARWHQRVYGEAVRIDWRQPGGTSEIVKQLEATFEAAARSGKLDDKGSFAANTTGFDLFFGGGSFEHSKMKEAKTAVIADAHGKSLKLTYRMGRPAGFEKKQLEDWFGENTIGVQNLYDPDQYWIGTALSGFGIVFNRDLLKSHGLPEPASFRDLCDFRYFGKLAMTDGRLSGSVTTTYESILNSEGWAGWRTLRELSANARYFASAATRAPVDVGQGEAAAGLAIDFYGRGQAQFLAKPGEPESSSRVGYVDPAGSVYIDADPVSMLNGAADPELAKRFIEYCLSEQAQSLWQMRVVGTPGVVSPPDDHGEPLGPRMHELRRMPIRRAMYAKYREHFVDQADPFAAASKVSSKGWRSAIGVMIAAFGIDTRPELVRAWRALNAARVGGVPAQTLSEMERLFYAMPEHQMRVGTLLAPKETLEKISKPARDELAKLKITTFDQLEAFLADKHRSGKLPAEMAAELQKLLTDASSEDRTRRTALVFSEANFKAIRADTDSWKDQTHGRRSLIAYTNFFREQYRRVAHIGESAAGNIAQ